jgi:hypothetical protein
MTAFIGWIIIVAALFSVSAVLLWPAFRLMRRSYPNSLGLLLAYVAAMAACSLALWYLIPMAVYQFFGRVAH